MPVRILGIDPGLQLTGFAVVDVPDSPASPRLVEAGVIRLRARDTLADRLHELDRDLADLLARTAPALACVESLYAHYRHPTTAIAMGHARGVILLAVRRCSVPLAEFRPNAVKKFLTGNGHASKEQMQRSVQALLGLAEPPSPPDVADAIAIALCAAHRCAPARPCSMTAI